MKTIQLQVSLGLDGTSEATLIDILRQLLRSAAGVAEVREARIRASQHANLAGQKMPEDKGLLIDMKAVAKLLDISERTVWGLANSERMPKPIKIGRLTRWSYEELRAWVNAGGPPLSKWKWPR